MTLLLLSKLTCKLEFVELAKKLYELNVDEEFVKLLLLIIGTFIVVVEFVFGLKR